jgi:2-iminobutanoate/2-iminopropanoate deaminase
VRAAVEEINMADRLERIALSGVPSSKGAYSQVIRAGDFLFVSGQGPIDPLSKELSLGDIGEQTTLVLQSIRAILKECGASMSDVVKCSVFLETASDFPQMDIAYKAFFKEYTPTRTTVQAGLVEPGMKIEIDCIAYHPRGRS